jgi:hypothetical protein
MPPLAMAATYAHDQDSSLHCSSNRMYSHVMFEALLWRFDISRHPFHIDELSQAHVAVGNNVLSSREYATMP